MAKNLKSVLGVLDHEWKFWGSSKWNLVDGSESIGHRDDEVAYANYVIQNYNKAGGGNPTVTEVQDDKYFWSAVGISYVFKTAGFQKKEFPFKQAHHHWIRKFIKSRSDKDKSALYWGYRLHEKKATPEIGDLVGYTYKKGISFEDAQKYFDREKSYPSHTDIVVAKRDREIDVIGFNVRDSVTMKTLKITKSGLIEDRNHKWFVVLKRKALA